MTGKSKHYLKPCPFCGEEVDLAATSKVIDVDAGNNSPCSKLRKVWIYCKYCGCTGRTATVNVVYEDEVEAAAAEAWNRRVKK